MQDMQLVQQILVFSTFLAPVILGLVEVVKRSVIFPKNYVPVVALVLGLLIGFLAQPFTDLDWALRLWAGGLAGLSATGLFELVRPTPGYTKGEVNE